VCASFCRTARLVKPCRVYSPARSTSNSIGSLRDNGFNALTVLPSFVDALVVSAHCFNQSSSAYVRIEALTKIRAQFPVLRSGRQYQRPISNFGAPFALPAAGELIAWSRVLDDEEALCIVNGNGSSSRGGDVLVDGTLNSPTAPGDPWATTGQPSFRVVANSAESAAAATGQGYQGSHKIGSLLPVLVRNGVAFVEIRDLQPSEVLVFIDR